MKLANALVLLAFQSSSFPHAKQVKQGDWVNEWHTGDPRFISGKRFFMYDPEDPRTSLRGTGKIHIEDGVLVMKENPSVYVEDVKNKGWKDVEAVTYVNLVTDSNDNESTGFTVGARCEDGNYRMEGCSAYGYYAYIDYSNGECSVRKEYYRDHSNEVIATPITTQCFPSGSMPKNTWIGVKFIVRTVNGKDKGENLELYLDYGDGKWNLQIERLDTAGGWLAEGDDTHLLDQCKHDNGDMISSRAGDCFFRSDGSSQTEVHLKDAHILSKLDKVKKDKKSK